MSELDQHRKPVVGRGFRLQWEPAQGTHVLLYPEGMVKLNSSAAAIMSRCDGVRTVADIVADIERTYGVTGLATDVTAFVAMAQDKSWLEMKE
ncbi:MAG TPA: pyrroloquinoline quinone biosynthesis peptide chaperone PqqD [Steroidobacteraceae bacterium]